MLFSGRVWLSREGGSRTYPGGGHALLQTSQEGGDADLHATQAGLA